MSGKEEMEDCPRCGDEFHIKPLCYHCGETCKELYIYETGLKTKPKTLCGKDLCCFNCLDEKCPKCGETDKKLLINCNNKLADDHDDVCSISCPCKKVKEDSPYRTDCIGCKKCIKTMKTVIKCSCCSGYMCKTEMNTCCSCEKLVCGLCSDGYCYRFATAYVCKTCSKCSGCGVSEKCESLQFDDDPRHDAGTKHFCSECHMCDECCDCDICDKCETCTGCSDSGLKFYFAETGEDHSLVTSTGPVVCEECISKDFFTVRRRQKTCPGEILRCLKMHLIPVRTESCPNCKKCKKCVYIIHDSATDKHFCSSCKKCDKCCSCEQCCICYRCIGCNTKLKFTTILGYKICSLCIKNKDVSSESAELVLKSLCKEYKTILKLSDMDFDKLLDTKKISLSHVRDTITRRSFEMYLKSIAPHLHLLQEKF